MDDENGETMNANCTKGLLLLVGLGLFAKDGSIVLLEMYS